MTTTHRAVERALEVGNNATEVLTSLVDQGFVVANQDALIRYTTEIIKTLPGLDAQAESIARTIIVGALVGANFEGLLGDG